MENMFLIWNKRQQKKRTNQVTPTITQALWLYVIYGLQFRKGDSRTGPSNFTQLMKQISELKKLMEL